MTNRSHSANLDEAALAEFMRELEQAANDVEQSAVFGKFGVRYPHLAAEMRDMMEMGRRIRETPRIESAEAHQLRPGQNLGAFRIVRQIAVGGMGEIYEAEQIGLHRHVALKVIRHGRVSPAARERFYREQRVLAKLHQTHIVPIFAAGEEENLQYFAMPFIDGVTIGRVIAAARNGTAGTPLPGLAKIVNSILAGDSTEADEDKSTSKSLSPVRFSGDYFRTAADAIAQVADAIHHAHLLGIVHRDLKPSNLMVDRAGQCWIIDFGLAGLERAESESPNDTPDAALHDTISVGPLGTPAYMAPEQHAGKPELRSDIWGLGATLFEVLTLRRAIDGPSTNAIREQILTSEPDLSTGTEAVPGDLLAICRRSLNREPARRYATAAAFADDLRRWLAHRPVSAHPDRVIRPTWLWLVRNWTWAAPLFLAISTAVGLIWLRAVTVERRRTDEAEAREHEERRKTAEAETREREQLLKVRLLELQKLRMTMHQSGWRDEALRRAREIASINAADVQSEAAGCLCGLDAKVLKQWQERGNEIGGWSKMGSGSVAYDDAGRLYVAGWIENAAFVWDGSREIRSSRIGRGPVGFADGNVPIRVLTPIASREGFQVVKGIGPEEAVVAEWALPNGMGVDSEQVVLSAHGEFVAAPLFKKEEKPPRPSEVHVWESRTGSVVRVFKRAADRVALTHDGQFLAVGGGKDPIAVYALPSGDKVLEFSPGWSEIRCLAFGRAPRPAAHRPESAWMIAAGYAGNTVDIVDVGTGALVSRCGPFGALGGGDDPSALAFDPSGTLLAIVGRSFPRLFDVFKGRFLLELNPERNTYTGVVFSPNGRRIATSSVYAHGSPGGADEVVLEPGRGTVELRGLSTAATQIVFSSDGRHLAAIGGDWQIGLWDRQSGRLRALWHGPHGVFADSIAMQFSPDGNKFAAVAGREAMHWDVDSGKLEWTKQLPPGLQDKLAFHSSGRLLLVRFEIEDGSGYPDSEHPPDRYPRVIRVRDMNASDHLKPLREIRELNWHVRFLEVAQRGDHIAAQGATRDAKGRLIAFDAVGDAPTWTVDTHSNLYNMPAPDLDTTSGHLIYGDDVFDLRTRKPVAGDRVDRDDIPFPQVRHGEFNVAICRMRRGSKLTAHPESGQLLFRMALAGTVRYVRMGPDRRHFAWSSHDGTVTIGDINAIRDELTKLGLNRD